MTNVVDECRRTWRRLGVPREMAEEMAADVKADIAAAEADGFSAAAVIGADPRAFATAWATERGIVRPRLRLALTAASALVGAVPWGLLSSSCTGLRATRWPRSSATT